MDTTCCEYLGRSFGGEVFSIPVGGLTDFYRKNWGDVSEGSGRTSFLSSCGIPPAFFDQRIEGLKESLITDIKAGVESKTDSLLALVQNGQVQYVAPNGPLGWEGPDKVLEMDTEKWSPLNQCLRSGMVRYVNLPETLEVDSYITAAYMNLPIFYQKPVTFEMGMYKVRCSNGMIDGVNINKFKMPAGKFSKDVFSSFVGGVMGVMNQLVRPHQKLVEYLKGKELSLSGARDILNQMRTYEGSDGVPKSLLKPLKQHVDALSEGEEVGVAAPQKIETEYDLLDTVTFYAHEEYEILSQQRRAEESAFLWFHKRHQGSITDGPTQVTVLDLASAVGIK